MKFSKYLLLAVLLIGLNAQSSQEIATAKRAKFMVNFLNDAVNRAYEKYQSEKTPQGEKIIAYALLNNFVSKIYKPTMEAWKSLYGFDDLVMKLNQELSYAKTIGKNEGWIKQMTDRLNSVLEQYKSGDKDAANKELQSLDFEVEYANFRF